MSSDRFAHHSAAPGCPASEAFAIVPGNDPLPFVTSAIYVGQGGHVCLRPVRSDSDVTYRNVPSGSYLTVRASHVRAVGTTATDLVGEV